MDDGMTDCPCSPSPLGYGERWVTAGVQTSGWLGWEKSRLLLAKLEQFAEGFADPLRCSEKTDFPIDRYARDRQACRAVF